MKAPTPADVVAYQARLSAQFGIDFVRKSTSPIAEAVGAEFVRRGMITAEAWPHTSSTFPGAIPKLLPKPTCFLSDDFFAADPLSQVITLAHEATHKADADALGGGGLVWVERYGSDPYFRALQELHAYATRFVILRALDPTTPLDPAALRGAIGSIYGIDPASQSAAGPVADSLVAEVADGGTLSDPTRIALTIGEGGPMRTVVIIDHTTGLPTDQPTLAATVAAIQRQVSEHFLPAWRKSLRDSGATEDVIAQRFPDVVLAIATEVPEGAWPVELVDVCPDDGALGFHLDDTIPRGLVGVATAVRDGIKWSTVLSHEVLELLADPGTDQEEPEANGEQWDLEVCDPVEGEDGYALDDVALENFVLFDYFRAGSPGPWDFRGVLTAPLTLAPGGYQALTDASGNRVQHNAERVRASKRTAHASSRRARRARKNAAKRAAAPAPAAT